MTNYKFLSVYTDLDAKVYSSFSHHDYYYDVQLGTEDEISNIFDPIIEDICARLM